MFGGVVSRSFAVSLASFKPQIPKGQRIYAVGDIHGCADLLRDLHARIEADMAARRDADVTIVYLGDYVDRGPSSAAVLDALIGTPPRGATRCLLKGNHEALMLSFLDHPESGQSWLRVGGLETLSSYGIDVSGTLRSRGYAGLSDELAKAMPETHRRALAGLRLSASVGDYFFCHAGVRPGVSLERQQEEDLVWIRDAFTASRVKFGKVVVHGHTPVKTPEVHPNRIAIDTEAYKTGRLSCLVLEGTEQRVLST